MRTTQLCVYLWFLCSATVGKVPLAITENAVKSWCIEAFCACVPSFRMPSVIGWCCWLQLMATCIKAFTCSKAWIPMWITSLLRQNKRCVSKRLTHGRACNKNCGWIFDMFVSVLVCSFCYCINSTENLLPLCTLNAQFAFAKWIGRPRKACDETRKTCFSSSVCVYGWVSQPSTESMKSSFLNLRSTHVVISIRMSVCIVYCERNNGEQTWRLWHQLFRWAYLNSLQLNQWQQKFQYRAAPSIKSMHTILHIEEIGESDFTSRNQQPNPPSSSVNIHCRLFKCTKECKAYWELPPSFCETQRFNSISSKCLGLNWRGLWFRGKISFFIESTRTYPQFTVKNCNFTERNRLI